MSDNRENRSVPDGVTRDELRRILTPNTWREYFDARSIAHAAKVDAQRAFSVAGQRLDHCNDRVRELKEWAEQTHETNPFDGTNHDEPVGS